MSTALGVINVITKAHDVFMEFVDILECNLNLDPFGFAFEINHIMQTFHGGIHIFHKTNDTVRLPEFDLFDLTLSAVFIMDGKAGI